MLKTPPKKPGADKDYCGSLEASKLLGVSVATVHKMLDSQVLEGWKTMGGHRKISLKSIRRIQAESGMVISNVSPDLPRLLIILADNKKKNYINAIIEASKVNINYSIMDSAFEALLGISDFNPDVLIADMHNQEMDGFRFLTAVAKNPKFKNMLLVIFSSMTKDDLKNKSMLPVRSIILPNSLNTIWFDGFLSGYAKAKNILI